MVFILLGTHWLPWSKALAADYPDRPVRWVVPYPPGGTTDVIARNVAQAITQALGWTVVIDNRAGAGGQVAMSAVAKGMPDGYALLVSDASLATAPSLYKQLSFDPVKDLQAVALFATVPHIVVVNPSVPANSLGELVALAKQSPGKLNFGSGGVGSPLHLAGEALRIDAPDSIRGYVLFVGDPLHWDHWGQLSHSVRTGRCAIEELRGKPTFEWLEDVPELAAVFNDGMTAISKMETPLVVAA